jgi:hypothetical protein
MDNISVIQTKKIEYEKIAGAWVKVYTEPTMGTLIKLSDAFKVNPDEKDKEKINQQVIENMPVMFPLLTKFIKEWNFIDEDGNALPITDEVVERLPYEIQMWLLTEFMKTLNTEQETDTKKKELPEG